MLKYTKIADFFKKIDEKGIFLNILFFALLTAFVYPILSNRYFLTGDGPSHLYNAKVLLEMFTGDQGEFYNRYLSVNVRFIPNWLCHIALAAMFPLLGAASERILLAVYVVGMALTMRWYFRTSEKKNEFIVLLALPFIMNVSVNKGFYNYSISLVFMMITLIMWMKRSNEWNWKKAVLFSWLPLLTIITHPVGWVFSVILCSSATLGSVVETSSGKGWKQRISLLIQKYSNLLSAFLPSLVIFILFIRVSGISASQSKTVLSMIDNFSGLPVLAVLDYLEYDAIDQFKIVLLLVFAYAFILKAANRKFNRNDGMFAGFVALFVLYIILPDRMSDGSAVEERILCMCYTTGIFWFASVWYHPVMKWVIALAAFYYSLQLAVERIPFYRLNSEAVDEYVSVGKHIPEGSAVMTLSFSHCGLHPDGSNMNSIACLFIHAGDYIGVDKNLLMLSNYEQNTEHFPLKWKPGRNPNEYIGFEGGIDNQPPCVDLEIYLRSPAPQIDYIVTWCMNMRYGDHPCSQHFQKQLREQYQPVHTSVNGRAKLFMRNSAVNRAAD